MYTDTVGDRIIRLRNTKHLSQAQLAEELGVSRVTISRIERDVYYPGPKLIKSLSEFFHVDAGYLLYGSITNKREVLTELDSIIVSLQAIRGKISGNPDISDMSIS